MTPRPYGLTLCSACSIRLSVRPSVPEAGGGGNVPGPPPTAGAQSARGLEGHRLASGKETCTPFLCGFHVAPRCILSSLIPTQPQAGQLCPGSLSRPL